MRLLAIAAVTAAALLLALAPPASAQGTTTALGYVLDEAGSPLSDVQVLLQYKGHQPQKYRTKTDKNGRFVHVSVWSGPYDITLKKEGLGEVTIKDYPVRDVGDTEKPPTFRLAQARKVEAPPPPADPGAAAAAAATATAGALAGDMKRGGEAFAAGRIDEAASIFEGVAAQAPNLPQVHHNLGLVYRKKGDAARAEAEFRKAVELDPNLADSHAALGVLLASQGKAEVALAEAEKASALAPQNAVYKYNLAVLYKDAGKSAEAKTAFLEAEALDPKNVEIQFQLASALLGLGDVPMAVERLEKYLATAPADAPNRAAAQGLINALKKK
jgi:tetratricopeptide (TPR) repeat protein